MYELPAKLEFKDVKIIDNDHEKALEVIQRAGATIQFVDRAGVFYRLVLGKQLLQVQAKQFWKHYLCIPRKGVPARPCQNFDEFMKVGLAYNTRDSNGRAGIAETQGWGAIQLAKSKTIKAMPAEDLARLPNLSSAMELTKEERRRGGSVPPEIVEKALTLPTKQFRAEIQAPPKVAVQTLVDGQDKADKLQGIFNFLKLADEDAVTAMEEVLDRARERAGENPHDCLYAIHAACWRQWDDEDKQEANEKALEDDDIRF